MLLNIKLSLKCKFNPILVILAMAAIVWMKKNHYTTKSGEKCILFKQRGSF